MHKTLAEIVEIIGGEVAGDKNIVITGLCGIEEAGEGDLSFITSSKYISRAETTKAAALIIPFNLEVSNKTFIRNENPSLAFAQIASALVEDDQDYFTGVHPTAVISDQVKLGQDVTIGPHVIIEPNVTIGDHTVIFGGGYIGHSTKVGSKCRIYPNVTIREKMVVGNNVVIQSGTVIGSDGFGYEKNSEGEHVKVPQLGIVVIEDDVEIGSNVTVDRARFSKTLIGRGTKIDNLVQIGHNVVLGENCIIISQVGISGSVIVGKGSILAGQSGVSGHLTIGEGSIVAAQSGVTRSIPNKSKVSGFPARDINQANKGYAHILRLPEYVKQIKDLQKRIEELEKKSK